MWRAMPPDPLRLEILYSQPPLLQPLATPLRFRTTITATNNSMKEGCDLFSQRFQIVIYSNLQSKYSNFSSSSIK